MSFNSVNLPLISRSRTAVGVRISATASLDTLSVQEGCRSKPSRGPGLKAPGPRRLDPENEIKGTETVAPCHQHRDAIARRVLFEPLIETIGPDSHLVDRHNLIVYVQAGGVRGSLSLHLCDEQTAGVDLRRRADPRFWLAVRRSVGWSELQTEDLESFAVIELVSAFDRRSPKGAEIDTGDVFGESAELVWCKAVRPGIAGVRLAHDFVQAAPPSG